MLGSYPIATRPLATLASALNVVGADATITATATASFDSQTVTVIARLWDSSQALTNSFSSQTIAQSLSSTAATLTVSADVNSTATSDFLDILSLTNSLIGSAFSASVLDSAPSLDSTFTVSAISNTDAVSSATIAFIPEAAGILSFDVSSIIGATVSWDGVGRLMSSADASVVLALSPSFDSAFSTVIGSVWSVIINPQIGPVINPVTIAAPGSGYNIGNQLRINGGDNNAVVSVTARTGTGVLIVAIVNAGTNYTPGTYTTTALSGQGSGCQVTIVVNSEFALFRSGATKGSVLAAPQTAATTGRALSFATVTSATIAVVTADMVSGATAGSVANTADSALADWQGMGIGPVPVDFAAVMACVASWSGTQVLRCVTASLINTPATQASIVNEPGTFATFIRCK